MVNQSEQLNDQELRRRIHNLEQALLRHTGATAGAGVPTLPHPNIHNTNIYTITNGTLDRTYDADASSTNELADIVYTLIQDLKTLGILS